MRKLLFFIFLLTYYNSFTQDLSNLNLKDKKPLKINGGLGINSVYYNASNSQAQRDPYFWIFNANINFELFEIINIPFSATFSKQNKNYSQPANITGLSPKYKWVTLHLGYRNMSFSGYTLGGLNFLGGGIELKPPNSLVKFSGLYGRFNKAVPGGTDGMISASPSYDRWGYGGKLTIGNKDHSVDLILFKARDDENSLSDFNNVDSNLNPKENLVLGLNTTHNLAKRIKLNLEYASSAFTEDTRSPEAEFENYTYVNNFGNIFTTRSSSSFNSALNTKLSYVGKGYQLQLGYKRVAPNYRSLGVPYLSNNVEDITGAINSNLFKNKLSLGVTSGYQQNNLDESLETTMKRFVGSVNSTFMITRKINMNLVYSNFTTNTLPVDELMLDSFKYIQITNNSSATINYAIGKKFKHHIMFNITYQKANTEQTNSSNKFLTETKLQTNNIAYNLRFPSGLRLQTAFRVSNFEMGNNYTSGSYGPSLQLSKSLLKRKLNALISSTLLNSVSNNKVTNKVGNFRLSISYQLGKRSLLALNNSFITRKSVSANVQDAQEYKGSLSFRYNF